MLGVQEQIMSENITECSKTKNSTDECDRTSTIKIKRRCASALKYVRRRDFYSIPTLKYLTVK